MSHTASQTKYHIRWSIQKDLPTLLAMERDQFEFPWTENDFVRCLRQRNCIGMVAEHDDLVVGFMIYELHATRLHLLNLATHPRWVRRGVGRQLVEKLIAKLSEARRRSIIAEARETNFVAQLFLRSMGFKALSVLRDFYDDTDEDAYLFRYRLPRHAEHSAARSSP